MGFDALTMAALADELKSTIAGGRVQGIVQTDERSIGLEIYARGRHYLLASVRPLQAQLYLSQVKPRRGVDQNTPFLLLLRKHLLGTYLDPLGINHLQFERVLCLRFESSESAVDLVMEAIGRQSNLILVGEDGAVLEAIRRVSARHNPDRPIWPGRTYRFPHPQAKLNPVDLTELRLRKILKEAGEEPAWRALLGGIAGVSPLFAREVIHRATGDALTPAAVLVRVGPLLDAFEEALIPLWEHEWTPCVVREPVAQGDGAVLDYAPYPLTHVGPVELVESISAAIEAYVQDHFGLDPYGAARAPLAQAIASAQDRLRRRAQAIAGSTPGPAEMDRLREWGQWVLTYAHAIEPGQTQLVIDLGPDRPALTIPLDPDLSPSENAQAYFKRYKKMERASAMIPRRTAATEWELAYLDQLTTDLALASDRSAIDEVREALVAAGYLQRDSKRISAPPTKPLRTVSPDGLVIWVGRNVKQNYEVTFRRAARDDLWLHVRGLPGGHIVVKSGGGQVPESTLLQAAALAAYYSAARDEEAVDVDVTKRAWVRPVKGGRPGMVIYRGEQTLRVAPAWAQDLEGD